MLPKWLKAVCKKENPDALVDTLIIHMITNGFDDFIGACMDENGKPKAPDRGALMKARSMMPANYKNTLNKS